MSTWINKSLINSCSPLIQNIIILHDYIIIFIVLITTCILFILITTIKKSIYFNNFKESQKIEIIWTLIPIIILTLIAIPSLKTLYSIEEAQPIITIKTTGHQWYWRYIYPEINNIEFDRYIKPSFLKNIRLTQTDNIVKIPYNINTRFLISSEDVIHAWTIPAIAVKADAVPGRINQLNLWRNRPGIFFGQCSEICGANHRFIPITLEISNLKTIIKK